LGAGKSTTSRGVGVGPTGTGRSAISGGRGGGTGGGAGAGAGGGLAVFGCFFSRTAGGPPTSPPPAGAITIIWAPQPVHFINIPDGGTRLSSSRWIFLQLAQDVENIQVQDIMAAMKRFVLLGLVISACAACAGSQSKPPVEPTDQHIAPPNLADDAKLTREQCLDLVDHAFEVYVRTNPSADDLAKAEQDRDAQKADDSINQCIQDVDGKFYKCVVMSETREAIDKCAP
jgi:hypothetical protein